jgi:AbrB family looped-hinge helix DNA binding protein
MTYTVSITTQGQISIPAPLRRKLGLDTHKKANVTEREGKLIIEPVKDFLELGGSLHTTKKPLANKELHDFVAQFAADDYAKKGI